MLFEKPTYEEIQLPFRLVNTPADSDEGLINIEAYGNVFGENKYCYASYELNNPKTYENGDFKRMLELLNDSAGKTVKVIIKLKKGTPKDFKIDINSLAEALGDERFKELSLLGWGFNKASCQ